jgi:hypothetical protein
VKFSTDTIINAPADLVWQVVAHDFAEIGAWASVITASRTNADAVVSAAEAPVGSRICETGSRFPQLEETILAYDEGSRTLTYAAIGLPAFVTGARVRWEVSAFGDARARASVVASMQLSGLGRLLGIPLRFGLTRGYKRTLDDLRHYVEDGQPSPRKQRRVARS